MPSWLFAQVFPFLSRHEPKPIGSARRDLLQGLSGEVLEIGAGSGVNFALYPSDVTLTATDYSRHMMKKLARPAREAGIDVVLRQADVRQLPFEDDSFDHTVATEVFCSVPEQQQGFTEISRVTRPGSSVRFLEHVAAEGGRLRRMQDWGTPVWRHLADGCHLNRETVAAIGESSLVVDRVEVIEGGPALFPVRVIHAHVPP